MAAMNHLTVRPKPGSKLHLKTLPALLLGIAAVIYFGLLLSLHIDIITAPVPIDGFEASMPAITQLIAHGHNPHDATNLPIYMDVYPPLYNVVMAPLVLLFGNTLFIHRLVAGIFIGLSCWLCFYAARKRAIPRIYAAAVAILLYAALLYYGTPVASTNALGLALFLGSVIIPWARNFSWISLLFSICLGILAFYTKQYFVLGPLYVALYLFLFQSKLRALQNGVIFGTALVISLVVIVHLVPFYLNDTIFAVRNSVNTITSIQHAASQLELFTKTYAGILGIVFIYWTIFLVGRRNYHFTTAYKVRGSWLNLSRLHSPLITRKLDYFTFCFVCSTLIVAFYLGRNEGNFMTYLFQLMSPFLLISSFSCFKLRHIGILVLFALLAIWTLHSAYAMISKNLHVDLKPWHRVDKLVKNNSTIFTSAVLIMPMIEHDKTLYNDGHTIYFVFSIKHSTLSSKDNDTPFYRDRNTVRNAYKTWQTYADRMYTMFVNKRFDLILVTPQHPLIGVIASTNGTSANYLLNKNYIHKKTLRISLTNRKGGGVRQIEVWKPKPG